MGEISHTMHKLDFMDGNDKIRIGKGGKGVKRKIVGEFEVQFPFSKFHTLWKKFHTLCRDCILWMRMVKYELGKVANEE
jgi:hypothetical protein